MPTSGSENFSMTGSNLIQDALESIGMYRAGDTISTVDTTRCLRKLNMIVKNLQKQGIHIWKVKEGTIFFNEDQNKYTLPSGATTVCGDNVIETTLTADGSGTSLTVDSTAGMSALDYITISLDDNTLQNTTIASVDSATALTLTDSLDSACSSGNRIGVYTDVCTKPVHISAARFNDSSNVDRPVVIKGYDDFMQIPAKTQTGPINQMAYLVGKDSTDIYVWCTPDMVNTRLKFSYVKQIEDFDSVSDLADLPPEWYEPLSLQLQAKEARRAGLDRDDITQIQAEAYQALVEMQLFDSDGGSLNIVPNYDTY